MLTFSTKSWHYRFATLACLDIFRSLFPRRFVRDGISLCEYMSMVFSGIASFALSTGIILWVLLLGPLGIYLNLVERMDTSLFITLAGMAMFAIGALVTIIGGFVVTGVTAGFVACIIGYVIVEGGGRVYRKLAGTQRATPPAPSLITEWLKAKKLKYCPNITFTRS